VISKKKEKIMEIACPHCQTRMKWNDEYWGKRVKCPKCKQIFVIQKPPEEQDTTVSSKPETPRSLDREKETIQSRKEIAPKPFEPDNQNILREAAQLPPRDDNVYKWRAVWKWTIRTLLCLGGAVLGLTLAYIDLYTPARIPFGWLFGLFLTVFCGLVFLLLLLITILILIKPTYICDADDIFDVVKSVKWLGSNTKFAVKEIGRLDDLSLQLVLPSHRGKLKDFLLTIDNIFRGKSDQYHNPYLARQKASYSISGFMAEYSTFKDNIMYGIASVEAEILYSASPPKKTEIAKVYVTAVKTGDGNWYLALPDLESPGSWIKFVPPDELPK